MAYQTTFYLLLSQQPKADLYSDSHIFTGQHAFELFLFPDSSGGVEFHRPERLPLAHCFSLVHLHSHFLTA